jgi:hypothetical protein
VELLDGPDEADVETTEFGWHAGAGLEVFAGRHFGIHGDYRYTFLDFGKDDDEGFIKGLLPAQGIDVDARGHDLLLVACPRHM